MITHAFYEFEVIRGREQESQETFKGAIGGSAGELKRRYPVGTTMTVHYDPSQPSNHFIEVERS